MARRPMASPPGSGRRASPQRASSAPSSSTEARMRATRSPSMPRGSRRSAEIVTDNPAEVDDQCISQPRRCSNDDNTATSRLAGTLCRLTRCGVRSADTISGSTAFFAPLIG